MLVVKAVLLIMNYSFNKKQVADMFQNAKFPELIRKYKVKLLTSVKYNSIQEIIRIPDFNVKEMQSVCTGASFLIEQVLIWWEELRNMTDNFEERRELNSARGRGSGIGN